jgi:wobble nucleotide-excising tRNase
MIRSIHLADTATYSLAGATVEPLTKCNFLYGPNGAGKTTLSRFLGEQKHPDFHACKAHWVDGRELKTVVYNREFVAQVFGDAGKVKGVFTLGTEDGALTGRMTEIRQTLKDEEEKVTNRTRTLGGADGTGGLQGELKAASEKLREACLKTKNNHDADFALAMKGVRGDSKLFMARLLTERDHNKGTLQALDDLKVRARSVFAKTLMRVEPLPSLTWEKLQALENDPIFKTAIVGKPDVNIAALVNKLKNSDWVSKGRVFLKESHPQCPFCQQNIPHSLEKDLEEFFDESFVTNTNHLSRTAEDYALAVGVIEKVMEQLSVAPVEYHDAVELSRLLELFDAKRQATTEVIARKIAAPSTEVAIEGVCGVLADIKAFVTDANSRIASHNIRVANATSEQTKLTADFWRYLVDVDLKGAIADYDVVIGPKTKAVTAIAQQIEASKVEQKKLKTELEGLEQKTTGTQATVDKINNTLRSFHFTNFHLEPAGEPHTYQLVRQNGKVAHTTLSEGERTFVTFLYFYHLAQGGGSATGIEDARIVVIDDPVSSLDSDILFIVSSLVRELARNVQAGVGSIRQLLVMTHNVYFHKEVTYSGGNAVADTGHWTVRKRGGVSEVVSHGNINPIRSSYELLWQDVRKPEGRADSLPNTLRRILESYFKLLGGINSDDIIAKFQGDEMTACRALLSWANEGSHGVQDDIHMAPADDAVDLYLDVFRRIFEREEHAGHYRMMMGTDFKERAPEVAAA